MLKLDDVHAFYGKSPKAAEIAPEGIMKELARLHYDTANATSAPAMAARFVRARRVDDGRLELAGRIGVACARGCGPGRSPRRSQCTPSRRQSADYCRSDWEFRRRFVARPDQDSEACGFTENGQSRTKPKPKCVAIALSAQTPDVSDRADEPPLCH